MKKYLFSMLAMATLLFTACSEDDFRGNGNGDEVTVAFAVQMPTVATRAYNPGEHIDQLVCVVFEDVNGVATERYREVVAGSNNFTFTPQLINGRTYDIVFWAQKSGAYNVENAQAIERVAGFDEAKYDAFTAVVENFEVREDNLTGNNVKLYRPFAQLNIGVTENDWNKVVALGYTPSEVVVTVDNAATQFNALAGKQVNTDQTLTFAVPVPAGEAIAASGVTYNLLASCFVLLEEGWPNATVGYTINTAAEAITSGTIENVPFDANYKTNIVGTLMTEQPTFNITIEKAFAPNDNVVSVWDGESEEEITPDPSGIYYVENAAQFAWLAGQTLNDGKIVFKSDIDMANNSMDHITVAYSKNLVVEGNNHVLMNLNVTYGSDNNGGANGISLFYVHAGSTLSISDLVLDGITANRTEGYAAAVVSYNEGTLNLENVHVRNSVVAGKKSVGGLIGHNAAVANINNCSVTNTKITATEDRAGGLVGRVLGSVAITNTTTKSNTVTAPTNGRELIGQRYKSAVTCTIDGVEYVTGDDSGENDAASLKSVIAQGASKILLSNGIFEIGGATGWASNVEIAGSDKNASVVKASSSFYADGTTVNFKNLTYTVPANLGYAEGTFGFIHHATVNMDNCNIDHLRLNVKGESTISNCTFTVVEKGGFDGYGLYYYGSTGSTVNVDSCVFNTVSKGIVMYNEGAVGFNLNVNDCEFNASTTDDKAAIQMHTEKGIYGTLRITNTTATGFYNAHGHGGLWNEVNNTNQEETFNFGIYVDGVSMRSVAIGSKFYGTLQSAIDAVKDGETIELLGNITEETVTIDKASGVAFTINGNGNNFTGGFDLGIGEEINIKDINFVATAEISPEYFIDSMDKNSNCILTITGCTFTDTDYSTVAVGTHQPTKVVVDGCEANGVHSLIQNQGGYNITVKNTTVNAARGMSLGSVIGATLEKVTINAADNKYGIRLNGENDNNTVTIKDCNIQAFIPVVVREAKVQNYGVVFDGTNTMTQKNTDGIWCAIGESEYDTNDVMPSAATGKVTVTLNDAGLDAAGIYGAHAVNR